MHRCLVQAMGLLDSTPNSLCVTSFSRHCHVSGGCDSCFGTVAKQRLQEWAKHPRHGARSHPVLPATSRLREREVPGWLWIRPPPARSPPSRLCRITPSGSLTARLLCSVTFLEHMVLNNSIYFSCVLL